MKIIIGLGNPGFRYRNTRHNVGFLVVKAISKKFGIPVKKRIYRGLLGKGIVEGEKIALFMPQTYMNLSGEAVSQIVEKEKIDSENVLVIYDDIDLKLGYIRLRKQGSSAGHKGLISIIERLGTSEFPRLRVGISKNGKGGDVAKFVLTEFNSAEKALLKDAIKEAAECAVMYVKLGSDKAMAHFNRRQFTAT